MKRRFYGFAGYSRVGKDTAAELLGIQRIGFADALKRDLYPLLYPLGLDVDADKDWVRPLMVEYGRLARAVQPDYWMQRLEWPEGDGPVAATDCRYQNEVAYILSMGGQVVLIERPGHGPANDEEAQSVAAIRAKYPQLPVVVNAGDKKQFATRLIQALRT